MKLSTLTQYLQERYPLHLTVPLSFFNAFLIVGLMKLIWTMQTSLVIRSIILIASCYFFMMLRQRCIDEFRDEQHDKKNFPNRPLPRGLVTKKQILILGSIAFLGEIASVVLLANQYWYCYLPTLLWFFFIMKDFFISKKWIAKHFTISFLMHIPVYLFMNLFFILAVKQDFTDWPNIFVIALIVFCWQVWIEILRKYEPRLDDHKQPVSDSYAVVWGKGICLTILVTLLSTSMTLTFLLQPSFLLMAPLLALVVFQLLAYKKDKMLLLGSFELAITWSIILVLK